MATNSEISLYTQDFYTAHKVDIDQSSAVGNVAELVEIDNYIYILVKEATWSESESDTRLMPDEISEEHIQADLLDLNAGVFNRYVMTVNQYLSRENIQLTPGEWYDPYEFERYFDETLGKYRWRLILTRDGTAALSIEVLNADSSYWYSPGSFLDQGGGKWLINSWDGEPDAAGREIYFAFIYGSERISQVFTVPADVNYFKAVIAYGDSTSAQPVAGNTPLKNSVADNGFF